MQTSWLKYEAKSSFLNRFSVFRIQMKSTDEDLTHYFSNYRYFATKSRFKFAKFGCIFSPIFKYRLNMCFFLIVINVKSALHIDITDLNKTE